MVLISISCTKVLDISPASYLTEPTYNSIYAGAFHNLNDYYNSYAHPGYRGLLLGAEGMGNDMRCTNGIYGGARAFYNFTTTNNFTSTVVNYYLRRYYLAINTCNVGIQMHDEGGYNTNDAENIIYAQLLSFRAMCYFDIARLFQYTYEKGSNLLVGVLHDKPINYNNASEGKELSTVKEFYDFFLKDIEEAIALFEKINYTKPNKGFIDKNVAYGLAARMYLTRGTIAAGGGVKADMDKAADYAYKAQEGLKLMTQEEFLGGFNDISNSEWMLALPQSENNSRMSYVFHYLDTRSGDSRAFYKNYVPDPYFKKLFVYDGSENTTTDTSNYDKGDIRFKVFEAPTNDGASRVRNMIKYPKFKFKNGINIGDVLYMRLSEMVLIEAEAKVRGGANNNAADAAAIITNLRTARGATTTGYTVDEDFIWKERRRELWGEGISGIFDINRLQKPVERVQFSTNRFREHTFVNTNNAGHDIRILPDGNSFSSNSPYYFLLLPETEILNNPKITGQLPR